jgi:pyruvate kinase
VLKAGQQVTLTCDHTKPASSSLLPISYPSLQGTGLQAGRAIFVGQYLFTGSETTSAYLTVQSVEGDTVTCICGNDCVLEGVQLTVHIGTMKNTAPILSSQDQESLKTFGLANHIDFVALSFCRCKQDVLDARAYLNK